jgi:flagellar M-ring protein FliF
MEGSDEAMNAVFGEAAEPQEVIKPITPIQDARREEIKQFAKSNPEIAAQMIKTWLRSED